jgi:TPR repeat protein
MSDAEFKDGICLRDGHSVAIDRTQAGMNFQSVSDQGHPAAQNASAQLMWDGGGASKALMKAIHDFHLAGKHGVSKAQYPLRIRLLTCMTPNHNIVDFQTCSCWMNMET